jgi:hypothetical protein
MSRKYWIKQLELQGMAEPRVVAPTSPPRAPVREDPSMKRPVCELCGGTPQLGRSDSEGGVRSLCEKCAHEEYLEMLKPEERALLR